MPSRFKSIRPMLASLIATAGIVSLCFNVSIQSVHAKPKATAEAKSGENSEEPIVEIGTTKGPILVKVFKDKAPITGSNFLDLVNRHFYDGLTFHRYEPGFVIQGGDPKGDGTGDFVDPKSGQTRRIKLEKVPGLTHDQAGTVAMARSSDPNSASCQFYITLGPAKFLDQPPGYAVFGKVVDGMDNVMKLRAGDKMTKVVVK